jgi:hypothetical protein
VLPGVRGPWATELFGPAGALVWVAKAALTKRTRKSAAAAAVTRIRWRQVCGAAWAVPKPIRVTANNNPPIRSDVDAPRRSTMVREGSDTEGRPATLSKAEIATTVRPAASATADPNLLVDENVVRMWREPSSVIEQVTDGFGATSEAAEFRR